jgi:hypothetical protein
MKLITSASAWSSNTSMASSGEPGPAFKVSRMVGASVKPTCSWAPNIWMRFIFLGERFQVHRLEG